MFLHEQSGLWFPDNEPRPQKMYDGLMKYINDSDFLLTLTPKKARKRVCVQAGGHIGLWPLKLAPHFSKVITFEPDPLVYEALKLNVEGKNIQAINGAVGEFSAYALLSWYSGRTGVSTMASVKDEGDKHTDVAVYTIDELEADVAAIVLDVEGYEPWVLRGARQTIERCRPLILCEMLAKSRDEITATLAGMNYLPVDNPLNLKCRDRLFAFEGRP